MSNCPTLDQLGRLALGTLRPDQVHEVATHVDNCPVCASQMERLDSRDDPLISHLRSRVSGPDGDAEAPSRKDAGIGPGTVLGDYLIEGQIGAGGMGQVFRASHRRMKRDVALKVLAAGMLRSVEAVQRFRREVEVAAGLVHPNIAMAYDAGEHQGTHYLILEYIDGQDLASRVKERGPCAVEEAVDVIVQAARGLAYAHQQGVVHRDIKPANVMVDRQRNVKILDLGLSRRRAEVEISAGRPDVASAESAGTDPLLTLALEAAEPGGILGTAGYLAPEQAAHPEDADARADVYALGCTLYFLLSGQNPLARDSVASTLRAHREEVVPALETLGVRVPRGLEAVLRRMLAKHPGDRLASMDEVVDALGRFTARARSARRVRVAAAGAIASVVFVGIAIGYATFEKRARERDPGRAAAADTTTAMTPSTTTPAARPAPPALARLPLTTDEAKALQARWATHLGSPVEQRNTLGMRLALIPPGEFPLSVRQAIRLTRPYYMGTCEVTVGQFRSFVEATKYQTRAEREGGVLEDGQGKRIGVNWRTPEVPQTSDHPVLQMSYEDAVAFCEWLRRVEGKPYRLPTEAQWEWAARAGTQGDHYWDRDRVGDAGYAWVLETSGMRTHPVGQLKPNAWGLYDTHGNVAEWCSDYYSEWPARYNAYDNVAEVLVDPSGPLFGTRRTLRGTVYRSLSANGVTARGNSSGTFSGFGFRVALDINE